MVAGIDIAERAPVAEQAKSADQAKSAEQARAADQAKFAEQAEAEDSRPIAPDRSVRTWWLRRLAPARLTSRIILINFVGLVILVGGILYSNQSRQSLIDARVQSLMTQSHIMAAAIASAASVNTDQIVIDPDRLLEMHLRDAPPQEAARDLDFLINPERVGPVLRRLVSSTTTRARIFDREGVMVVDSRHFFGRGDILSFELPSLNRPSEGLLLGWWNALNEWLFDHNYPPQQEYGFDNGKEFAEVAAALNGASVSVVRVNEAGEIIVSVAVPVQRYQTVLGSLVLSTRGGEIDAVLRNERKIVLFTFLVAALVAILLSVALAGHIAEPIRRLASSAEHVRRGVKRRVMIPDFTSRRDEIGHLSGALRDMTRSLYNRIDAIEAFAADVAHELKNPLTSLRSAVETFAYARNDEQRARLISIITDDVKRLDRLITDISDASRLDAELVRSQAEPVDMAELLSTLVSLYDETRRPGEPGVKLDVVAPPKGVNRKTAYMVLGHDNRLGQVVRNLLDNGRSFSPPDSTVTVRLRRNAGLVEVRVEDEGPGITADNLETIFQRFYTDRPEGSFGKNSGLGLSISKQIVEAYKGEIWAENRLGKAEPDGSRPVLGARFVVRIPAMPEHWQPDRER
ncbi:MAG: stimulus-sensing domain-containing protein [Hyphomicrobiales bacterium]